MAASRSSSGSLWDPERLFSIKNPEKCDQFTCVGYAPSQRRRCRNPIAYHNQVAAKQLLRDLSFIEPGKITASEQQSQKLQTVAYYSLCRRYHQDQANKMVTNWTSILREEQRQLGRRLRNERLQSSRREEAEDADSESSSTFTRRASPSRSITPPRRPASRADSVISPPALPSPPSTPPSRRETAMAVQPQETEAPTASPAQFQWPPSGPLSFNWPPSNPSPAVPPQEPSPPTTPPRAEEPQLEAPVLIETPAAPPAAIIESSSTISPTIDPSPALTPCTANHVNRRTTDEDCPICTTAMVNTPQEELVWCKTSCGRSVHRECFDAWQNHRHADAQCVYW